MPAHKDRVFFLSAPLPAAERLLCNLTTEVAVLLTLYVALAATHSDKAWQILRRQLCRK
jgi:hypothetical protein